jgi:hypothetical protein
MGENGLLPTKIGHKTAGLKSRIEGDIRNRSTEENLQGIKKIAESEGLVGNNLHGSDNNLSSQTISVSINFNGNTINIYQYPEGLIELLLSKLIEQ